MPRYTRFASSVLFPLHERLKRHDSVAIRAELEASQWRTRAEIESDQGQRLQQLITAVSRHVPFYRDYLREHGLNARDFTHADALAALPVIDKQMIRTHFAAWRADNAADLIAQRTSGSSGEPLHFLLGRHRISFDIAAKWRATRWWDVDIGDRELVLWGSSIETGHQSRLQSWRDALFRSRLVSTHNLTPARMDAILDGIRQWRPRMLFGYPSALSRLAFHARASGKTMDDLGIRVAFCTSEVLRPEWRAAIGDTFGCGVANEYGARDAGFIARECPNGGLHVTAEEVIVEIVDADGRPLPPGNEGEVVVTNLAGPEFPFIRYRTSDRGVLSTRQCACGRGLPLLEAVSGRSNDGLVGLDGRWVHGSAVNHVMRDLAGLRAYRIVQHDVGRIVVMLALDAPDSARASTGARLTAHLRELLGGGVQVEIEWHDTIPPLPNGKFRHIICTVDTRGAPMHPGSSGSDANRDTAAITASDTPPSTSPSAPPEP